MKKKNVKYVSILISILSTVVLLWGSCVPAYALSINSQFASYDDTDILPVLTVSNNQYNNINSTNIGGISVGTANNRLFVVKSNNQEPIATLYYYKDLNDSNVKKNPKKIIFTNGLLGHANSMAIDDEYIYVARWQKSGSEKMQFYASQDLQLENCQIILL